MEKKTIVKKRAEIGKHVYCIFSDLNAVGKKGDILSYNQNKGLLRVQLDEKFYDSKTSDGVVTVCAADLVRIYDHTIIVYKLKNGTVMKTDDLVTVSATEKNPVEIDRAILIAINEEENVALIQSDKLIDNENESGLAEVELTAVHPLQKY